MLEEITVGNIDRFDLIKNCMFVTWQNRHLLPSKSGIYVITNKRKNIIYYIGKSTNIARRNKGAHHVFIDLKNIRFTEIGYIVLPNKLKSEITQIEKFLIEKYKPRNNKNCPAGVGAIKQIGIYMTDSEYKSLKMLAEEENTSVSAFANRILRKFVENHMGHVVGIDAAPKTTGATR